MKETTKRILSLVLAFVMVLGLLPGLSVNVSAAEDVIDAAIFCSDVHGNPSMVTSVFNGIKSADSTFAPSTASFVGDTQCASSSVTSAAQSVFPGVGCYYAFGNHDDDEGDYGISDVTGLIYGDSTTNYYIYAISENSMASPNPDTSGFTSTVAGLDKTKPLFIISHMPLHARRGDNYGAAAWYEAISAAAESMDIFFFWAHNHTNENDVDIDAYYVAKDGTETMDIYQGETDVVPNFTYMNAGYINANDQNAARKGIATTVQITADSLIFQDYSSSGEYTGTYAHNVEVAREFANTTDSGEDGSTEETTEPTEGETTTGGSTETVVGEGTYTTADDGSYQKVTFGTEGEQKTVYVLVSTPTAGKNYIIASGNSGTVYALKENTTTGTSVTVNAATDSITAPYIENSDNTIVWTASSGMNFKSVNGGYYLNYSESKGSYSVSFSTSSASNWTAGTNTLYRDGSKNDYYLRYNSGWTMGGKNSEYNVYFYEEQTIDTSSSVTYSVSASDIEHFYTADTTDTETVSISASVTDGTPDGTYAYEVMGGDNIITSISDGVITFNGTEGTAQVKVSYTWTEGENTYTIWQVIDVTATSPYYTLDITSGDDVVTGTTIAKKGVTNGQELQLGTQIQFVDEDGAETVELPEGATIQWNIPEEYHSIATVDQNTGLVIFKGVDGAFYVTATLTVGGKDYTVGVNISATTSQYSTPTDGTDDFPEYPNEGAIRFDKTGTAVGNFSETGIAQIELSMTGVPYTTGSEVDVVIMLDMTGSMSDTAMTAAEESAIAFAEQIVKNTDGTYNQNRIAVLAFNSGSSSPYTLWSMGVVTEDTWSSFCTNVRTASDKKVSGGTPYDKALEKCRSVLQAAKTDGIGNDRQQFCVFVSDGGPTSYQYITNYDAVKAGTASDYTTKTATASGGSNQSDSNFATIATYTHEYYSTLMKDDGVTMYSVLTGLVAANYPNCTTIMQNIASDSTKAFVVENGNDTSSLTNAFSDIAVSILQAATDITVEDKITDEYTMIFDIPEGSKDITGVTNDFYIEFGKYALDEDHERTTFTSVTKLYLENTDDVLSAKDSTDPVFEQKPIGDKGTLYYWTTDDSYASEAAVTYTNSNVTYYFIPYGMKSTDSDYDADVWFNMTSGAYAHGTVDSTTNMSEDLVIATPYFVYNASDKMIYWTVDKLDTYEYTLSYFLYLNNSATEVATAKETDPGPYPTNDHAYITYTNFKGNDCRQVFPIPQLTWNGAQVSYVFYLVNAQGQPINKSGQVVDFANATFITDVYTEAVVWNKAGETSTGTGELSANWLADDLLPDEYDIYDEQAHYALNVYENADGSAIKNQFTISGGTAGEISTSLNTRLDLETTASTVSTATTKVYNTKAGEKISAYGTYTSADSNMTGFDFANTTVAFAVVWQPRLVEDVVVVDYGLDVIINVVQNDILQNAVSGIGLGNSAYGNIAMNTGVSTESKLGTAALTIDGNTIAIENETSVRFHQGDMEFNKAVEFYYETPVKFWEGSNSKEGYMYSSVTVIPATTIYYEDNFVELSIWDMSDVKLNEEWAVVGTTVNDTQDQDRPGDSKISDAIDADNIYGYDSAYTDCAMYSMGSARVVTVDDKRYAEAQFTFYGTGFDIISLTSNTSGTISVDVYGADDFEDNGYKATVVKSGMVDTYYGYTQDAEGNWVVDTDFEGKLYQIPVMKISDLDYGKYTVIITTAYYSKFDHQNHGSLDFYLDAVRIYDPTGNEDFSINDYYVEDHEGWPVYQELRNNVIESADDAGQIAGAVYIDGAADNVYAVADYNAYGPNNELYLAPGQMIAFSMNLDTLTELDKLHIAMKSANGGTVSCQIFDAASIQDQGDVEALKAQTIATATDLYYDISDLKDDTIVIYNSSTNGAILSITNLKATFTEDPGGVTINFSVIEEGALTALLTALNTAETEGEETTDPTDPSEPSEGTEDENTGSGSSSTIGRIIDWLRKLLGWG